MKNDIYSKIFSLFLFLKIKTLSINLRKIEQHLNLNGNGVHFWTLFNLMLEAITLCHIIGTL